MGSTSDWDVMQHCVQTLESLGIGCERRALSAHRTPHLAIEWVSGADARGLKVIIAAAGGAAHLPGMTASHTTLPVIGVPVQWPERCSGWRSVRISVEVMAIDESCWVPVSANGR